MSNVYLIVYNRTRLFRINDILFVVQRSNSEGRSLQQRYEKIPWIQFDLRAQKNVDMKNNNRICDAYRCQSHPFIQLLLTVCHQWVKYSMLQIHCRVPSNIFYLKQSRVRWKVANLVTSTKLLSVKGRRILLSCHVVFASNTSNAFFNSCLRVQLKYRVTNIHLEEFECEYINSNTRHQPKTNKLYIRFHSASM
jgi:hypothetical protein